MEDSIRKKSQMEMQAFLEQCGFKFYVSPLKRKGAAISKKYKAVHEALGVEFVADSFQLLLKKIHDEQNSKNRSI